MTKQLMQISDFKPFVQGLDHPEGVTWGSDGFVYAGGEAGQIYQINLDNGTFREIGNTGGFILGLALDADHNIYACDSRAGKVLKITQAGVVSAYSDNTDPLPLPNYPVFDRSGNLYFSVSGDWQEHNGKVYRIAPNGKTEVVSTALKSFPNGIALSPDGEYLYVVLSDKSAVDRARVLPDGKLGRPETVITLPKNVPDGIAFDSKGNLYISCYTPDIIYRATPAGKLDVVAEDWQSVTFSSPTNIIFAGQDLKTLVVASLARWHLTKGTMPIAGHPLHYPKLK